MADRFYNYTILKGEDSKVVNAVVSYLQSSYLRIETTVSILNALAKWGSEFEILCEGDTGAITYLNSDFDGDPLDAEEREAFLEIIKNSCPKEYLIRMLDLAYSALNPVEYVISNGDAVKRSLTPSEEDIQFCKERLAEAIEFIK